MRDETLWIQAVLAGDRDQFRGLVERHQGRVVRFAQNLLGDREEAEDIAQEVFVAAYEALPTFDSGRARFSTWLLSITRNRSLNALRRRTRARPEVLDLEATGRADWSDVRVRLDRALAALPEEQRTVFLLAEVEELTYPEIARLEAVPVGTVKSRVHRARERLKETLSGVWEDIRNES